MEKHLNKPACLENIMIASLQSLKELRLKLGEQEEVLKSLAAKIETSPANYFTIAGYCNLRGLNIDVGEDYGLEQRAMWLSEACGLQVGKCSDPALGEINTYHLDVLGEVFDSTM